MTFHRNLVRGAVSAVLSALVLFLVVPFFTENIPFEESKPKTIESVAFSPDGQTLASSGAEQVIKLWDAFADKELVTFKGDPMWIKSIAFPRDGKILASGGADQIVRLWDVTTGVEIKRFAGHSGMVFSVAFSPDGKSLASGGADQIVRLWDVATGVEIKRFAGHSGMVFSVTFSPDMKYIASSSADQTLILWDAATGRVNKRFAGHKAMIFSTAFSPDGKVLVSGGGDSVIIFWDVATGQQLSEIKGGPESVSQLPLALNTAGDKLAAGINDVISLWPIEIKSSKLKYLVPDVTGQTLVQARRILNEAGFKAGSVTSIRPEGTQSIVVQQDPSPGTGVQKGSAVNLVLTADAKSSDDIKPDEKIDPKVSALIEQLRNNDSYFRQNAAESLSYYGPEAKAAIPALIDTLKDNTEYVRAAAARALGQIGPDARAAVPSLIEALRDQSENVRKSATEALAKIGPEAMAAASKIIEKQKQLREKAVVDKIQMGRLYVETAPENARVRIMNIRPRFYQGIELEPGRYHLVVSADGYESQERWIELGAGEDKRINFELIKIIPKVARLYVQTVPKTATVRFLNINAQFSQGMELEPGRYQVAVFAEGYKSVRQSIELRAGDNTLNIRLERSVRMPQQSSDFSGTGKGDFSGTGKGYSIVYELYYNLMLYPENGDALIQENQRLFNTQFFSCLDIVQQRAEQVAQQHSRICKQQSSRYDQAQCEEKNEGAKLWTWTREIREAIRGYLPWSKTTVGWATITAKREMERIMPGQWESIVGEAMSQMRPTLMCE